MNDYEDDDIITLQLTGGETVDFVEVAGCAHKGKFYVILAPVTPLEGMADDEAFVFRMERDENGEDAFSIVTDEDIIDAVFKQYYDIVGNSEKK